MTRSAGARAHGTTWQALARINGLADPDRIFPGQIVLLPQGTSTIHVVRRSDTLGAIAAANGTTIGALARINALADPDRIMPGQAIRLGGAPTPSASAHAAGPQSITTPPATVGAVRASGHRLGGLSEVYESGNRGPGTVSTGGNDPGGVSYGVYQLSSKAGTLQSFMRNEGARWSGDLAGAPGSRTFDDGWQAIVAREPQAFRAAQHAFIQRTHDQPALAAVAGRTGLDLNSRHDAVRDAVWSVSVQHAGAATIRNRAVATTDAQVARGEAGYDRALINNIYAARTVYVLDVAAHSRPTAGERAQLIGVTRDRYPAELRDALRITDGGPSVAATPTAGGASGSPTGTIDGNAVARENGVAVKSARVQMERLDASMSSVIEAVAQAARGLGLPRPVITSANDSRHRDGSLHYENRTLHFRGNNISVAEGRRLEAAVKAILRPAYDIEFETFADAGNNHLHVEHDPN